MSEQHILVVEADGARASRILSVLAQVRHETTAVPNCAEAAEALMLQRFDAVLLGSGQPGAEIAELAGCVHGMGNGARLFSLLTDTGVQVDGVLPPDFDAAQLETALRGAAASEHGEGPRMAVFEPEEFSEQCADETSLMVEIIELFEGERDEQLGLMWEALAAGDFDRLGKLAHTLKGSVGALHAPASRQSCQAIELAAKDRDPELCRIELNRLAKNLADLAEPLSRFKESCLER